MLIFITFKLQLKLVRFFRQQPQASIVYTTLNLTLDKFISGYNPNLKMSNCVFDTIFLN